MHAVAQRDGALDGVHGPGLEVVSSVGSSSFCTPSPLRSSKTDTWLPFSAVIEKLGCATSENGMPPRVTWSGPASCSLAPTGALLSTTTVNGAELAPVRPSASC